MLSDYEIMQKYGFEQERSENSAVSIVEKSNFSNIVLHFSSSINKNNIACLIKFLYFLW